MAKDLVKEGIALALGIARISANQFDKAISGLEKRHKVSRKESEAFLRNWAAQQLRQMEAIKAKLRREALKTRLYSSKDLAKINGILRSISAEVSRLEKKKRKAESPGRKARKKKKR